MTVLTTDTYLSPWRKVSVVRELVVPPRVTEVVPTVTLMLPKVKVVLVQEMDDVPQEMAYLVLRNAVVPLEKLVLLDRKVVFQSPRESLFNVFAGLGVLVLGSGFLSI